MKRIFSTVLPYLLIFLPIVIFNIEAIWGLKIMDQDDQHRYFLHPKDGWPLFGFGRLMISRIFVLGMNGIILNESLYLARLIVLVFFMLPSAALLFYLFRRMLNLPVIVSLTAAILPFILPSQTYIPTYVTGSYFFVSLIFGLLAIICGLKFLRSEKFNVAWFLSSVVSYFLATESSELLALYIPVMIIAFIGFSKYSSRQIYLNLPLIIISLVKIIRVITKPYANVNNVSNVVASSEKTDRFIKSFEYMNPFGIDYTNYGWYFILALIVLIALFIVFRNPEEAPGEPENLSHRSSVRIDKVWFIYLFGAAWTAVGMFPFIFYSGLFRARYFITPSIGFILIICFSLYVILRKILPQRNWAVYAAFVILIAFAGITRDSALKRFFKAKNLTVANIGNHLASQKLPADAQVVVTCSDSDVNGIGSGVYSKSSACLRYMLGRQDVSGQIMKELNYYDPFELNIKYWEYRNKNIDLSKPTFLYSIQTYHDMNFTRFYHALQWEENNKKDPLWTIYRFDDSGVAGKYSEGKGWAEYEIQVDSLERSGITRDMIMFGRKPTTADSLRLGLK